MPKRINLVGQKIGRLEVLEYSHTEKQYKDGKIFGGRAFWKCKCDCGNEKIVRGDGLTSKRVKSCGCLDKEVKTSCKKPKGHTGLTNLILTYKNGSKEKNIDFNLSREEFKYLTSCNCFYCGEEPSNIKIITNQTNKKVKENSTYVYNGIDRVDNTKGYIIDNVVPCCKRCNVAKNDMSYDEFIELVKRINANLEIINPYSPSNNLLDSVNKICVFEGENIMN